MLLGVFQKRKNVINYFFIHIFIIVKEDKDDKLFTPSPTKYEIKLKSGSPKWTINGMSRKSHSRKPKTPGCGRYEYKSYIGEGPKYSFGYLHGEENNKENEEKKLPYKKFEVPGPGFYTIEDKNTGPKYSMYSRNHDSNKNIRKIKTAKSQVPGVGKYEIRKEINADSQSFTFSHGLRTNLVLNETALKYPEPGKYDIDFKFVCTTTPSWSFAQEVRFPYMKTKNPNRKVDKFPGPGTYSTKQYIGTEGPFFTFSKLPEGHELLDKDEMKKSKEFPSVGKYINDIRYIADYPFYTISKRLKNKKTESDKGSIKNLGPIYNPNKDFSSTLTQSPKWSWSLSKVPKDEDPNQNDSKKNKTIIPGPGEYNYKGGTIPQGPKFTMRKILKNIKIMNFPGPGEYNIRKEQNKNEGYSMGKETRGEDLRLKVKENLPGPGKYTIKDVDLVKCFTFSKSKKLANKKDTVPGPGSYKIPSSFNYINSMTREKGAYNPRFKYI